MRYLLENSKQGLGQQELVWVPRLTTSEGTLMTPYYNKFNTGGSQNKVELGLPLKEQQSLKERQYITGGEAGQSFLWSLEVLYTSYPNMAE